MNFNRPTFEGHIIILLFTINVYSQTSFSPAHYIDNDGKKIECQIKDLEWNSNPTSFKYKINDDLQKISIYDVKSFHVNNSSYIRYTVDVDISRSEIHMLSQSKALEFKKKTIFLKVLLEGDL